jgi:hypothetical protein
MYVSLFMKQAIQEKTFCNVYALIYKDLSRENLIFKSTFLNALQYEFEEKDRSIPSIVNDKDLIEELTSKNKREIFGVIRLISEIYKLGLLPKTIIFSCISKLLNTNEIEQLCILITNIGSKLDSKDLEYLFTQIKIIAQNQCNKIRFMVEDLIDLKNNKWIKRKSPSPQKESPKSEIKLDSNKIQMLFEEYSETREMEDFMYGLNTDFKNEDHVFVFAEAFFMSAKSKDKIEEIVELLTSNMNELKFGDTEIASIVKSIFNKIPLYYMENSRLSENVGHFLSLMMEKYPKCINSNTFKWTEFTNLNNIKLSNGTIYSIILDSVNKSPQNDVNWNQFCSLNNIKITNDSKSSPININININIGNETTSNIKSIPTPNTKNVHTSNIKSIRKSNIKSVTANANIKPNTTYTHDKQMQVCVKNLSCTTNRNDLIKIFGNIGKLKIFIATQNDLCKGFAYITFEHKNLVHEAINKTGELCKGKYITVEYVN